MQSSALFLIGAKLIGFSHPLHKYLFFHFIILIIAAEIRRGYNHLAKPAAEALHFPASYTHGFSKP